MGSADGVGVCVCARACDHVVMVVVSELIILECGGGRGEARMQRKRTNYHQHFQRNVGQTRCWLRGTWQLRDWQLAWNMAMGGKRWYRAW